MAPVITSPEQIDFTVDDLPQMPLPRRVLMVTPKYFTVEYVINPHMADQVGNVDKVEAINQWEITRNTFEQLELNVEVINGQPGLPDMVFCANQSLPFVDPEGDPEVIMSIMHTEQRKEEVPHIEQWYRQHGFEIHFLDEEKIDDFEGCGDAIWHTGRRLLWGGYGYRSSVTAYESVSDIFNLPVIALELVDESFYHLDTCLCVLDEQHALIYPDAFTDSGRQMIYELFDSVIEASAYEAKKLFACNATCPDGQNVIIQRGCTDTNKKLRDEGFAVHEVETSEYLKSGGSIFCMKQMIW